MIIFRYVRFGRFDRFAGNIRIFRDIAVNLN